MGKENNTVATTASDPQAVRAITENADCIIFDCDGVLVDVSHSYYMVIHDTVYSILLEIVSPFAGFMLPTHNIVSKKMIEKFKDTGLYNDEVDVACAIILAAIITIRTGCTYESGINGMVRHSKPDGIRSAITYAQKTADVADALEFLEHPSADRKGRLNRVFDGKFYGPDILPVVDNDTKGGLAVYDRLIMTEGVMDALRGRFKDKIAILTGRGRHAAGLALGDMIKRFSDESVFLEDEPRENAKPNPARLDECIRGMGCRKAVYVGDSAEDAMMARDAKSDVVFCGIVGTSVKPAKRRRVLEEAAGSAKHFILESVLDIPEVLGLPKNNGTAGPKGG